VKHLTSLQLCAFLDDVLVGAPDDQTARHLAACAICRTRYESWCHVDDSLRELLGQDPDEHAMEQRMAWVEIAVAAERKGLPAPEFAELRIPLGHAPGPRTAAAAAPVAPASPREPLMRPVLHAPPPQAPGPEHPTTTPAGPRPGPQPVPAAPHSAAPVPEAHRLPAREPVAAPYATRAGAASAPGPAAGPPGYARMPRRAPKGFAAFVSRPAVWLTLALVALLATALPLGVAKFGVPEITFGFHPSRARDSDVRKAAADAGTDRDDAAGPARPRKRAAHSSTTPENSATDPDASVIFDLPALEPEDGEPDSGASDPAPRNSAPAADRDGDARRDAPMICGEVRTTQGVPIEGARVTLTSPLRIVRTDRSGRFCVACPAGQRTIRIEATGRAPVTRTVQLGSRRLETRFKLDAAN